MSVFIDLFIIFTSPVPSQTSMVSPASASLTLVRKVYSSRWSSISPERLSTGWSGTDICIHQMEKQAVCFESRYLHIFVFLQFSHHLYVCYTKRYSVAPCAVALHSTPEESCGRPGVHDNRSTWVSKHNPSVIVVYCKLLGLFILPSIFF